MCLRSVWKMVECVWEIVILSVSVTRLLSDIMSVWQAATSGAAGIRSFL